MKDLEERAKEFADNYVVGDAAIITDLIHIAAKNAYWHGAIDQRRIDIDKACEWLIENSKDWLDDDIIRNQLDLFIDTFKTAMK